MNDFDARLRLSSIVLTLAESEVPSLGVCCVHCHRPMSRRTFDVTDGFCLKCAYDQVHAPHIFARSYHCHDVDTRQPFKVGDAVWFRGSFVRHFSVRGVVEDVRENRYGIRLENGNPVDCEEDQLLHRKPYA